MPWVRFPETYIDSIERAVEEAEDALCEACPRVPRDPELEAYALVLVATDTQMDRAIAYLEDCGYSAVHAKGRLLLRAAERALRHAGSLDPNHSPEQDKRPL